MFSQVSELFLLLDKGQRKRFLVLQALVIFMVFSEMLGIVSIGPFMAVVGDPSLLQKENILSEVFHTLDFQTSTRFLIFLGAFVLIMLTISSVVSMFTAWKLSVFAISLGAEVSNRLYSHYLNQNWLFHSGGSSAELTKKVTAETSRLTFGVFLPLVNLNAKFIFLLFLSISIVLVDPVLATVGLSIFTFGYLFLFKVVKSKLERNGRIVSNISTDKYRLLNEGFGGVKDVILLGKSQSFVARFVEANQKLSRAEAMNQALAVVPRYFMELVAFGAMILLVIYLLVDLDGDLSKVLPMLSIYALAGFKLLPAFQQVYTNLTALKGNISAYESVREDLINSSVEKRKAEVCLKSRLIALQDISFKNVSFEYPSKPGCVLSNIDVTIKVNTVVGLVGYSGSGKSTLVDIFLGLLKPTSGSLNIDGQPLTEEKLREWQNSIGYVAQSIFLSEGSIAENVAFGVPEEKIDYLKVNRALRLAHMEEFVGEMLDGLHTRVGERGVQLSGGQRQRIGIARALYHDADVLVFDEATSALDGITEKNIMDAIHDFIGKKTIVMIAHRLKTVQKCDQIFVMDKGEIVDQGTYQELLHKNKHFQEMANHA